MVNWLRIGTVDHSWRLLVYRLAPRGCTGTPGFQSAHIGVLGIDPDVWDGDDYGDERIERFLGEVVGHGVTVTVPPAVVATIQRSQGRLGDTNGSNWFR